MNTIRFNNSAPIEIRDYSNGIFFRDGYIERTGTCTVALPNGSSLASLGENEITQIRIYNGENLIYNLENITGHIVSITEVLDEERVNVLIAFNISTSI